MSSAAARASGYTGTANALTGSLGTYLNYTQNQARNALLEKAIAGGARPGMSWYE